jgi:multiple sugar transport system permease protein
MSSPSRAVSGAAIYSGLAIGAVITLAPFTLGVLTSLTSARQFNTGSRLALPRPPTLENYTGLAEAGFGRALVVTALMTAVILVGQLTFSVLAAYAFARLRFPGRDIFLLREYFRTIPADLIKAATVDGANTLDVIVHVVVPASRPILVTLALITVVSQWNNFMWPLVITSGGKWQVLTVATAGLQSRYNAQWTLVMAATTVAIVPLIVLFVVLGRHIVRSIVVTGLK